MTDESIRLTGSTIALAHKLAQAEATSLTRQIELALLDRARLLDAERRNVELHFVSDAGAKIRKIERTALTR
jgi:hypothetical protein